MHEKRMHAADNHGAGKKITNSFVQIHGKSEKEENIWAVQVLRLFRRDLGGDY